jgi:hypothetical protein
MGPIGLLVAAATLAWIPAPETESRTVEIVRVPDQGIQPEVVVDGRGTIHMVYLAGDPAAADVFYARAIDGERTFSSPVRVNSQPGSAIATGTIRGAHLALGRGGRVHVAWNGSSKALPQPPVDPRTGRAGMPMLYARSDPSGAGFEPQRNLMTTTIHLDGGGSIAADDRGGVFVAWHANALDGGDGEAARRVWIARSLDDGATFARERAVSDPSTGACGCCAIRFAAMADGALHLLYRSARETVHRDIYALVSIDRGLAFRSQRIHGWEIGACPMTSMSILPGVPALYAWETDGQVYFARAGREASPIASFIPENGKPQRKHPRIAINSSGTVLLTWADGTAWNRGGAVAWQAFDRDGRPTGVKGIRPGVPAWSFAAVVARRGGSFVLVH